MKPKRLVYWNAERLKRFLRESLEKHEIRVVSTRAASVEPVLKAYSGVWIADGKHRIADEIAEDRFASDGLWPLCQLAHVQPRFREEDWTRYLRANEKFARLLEGETQSRPVVLVHDFQFAPLPRLIRRQWPDAVITFFWNIPWSTPEMFATCPWWRELLEGMLGADVIGFHTEAHCRRFLATVERLLEGSDLRVDRAASQVTFRGQVCAVKPFPMGVDIPSDPRAKKGLLSERAATKRERSWVLAGLGLPTNVKLGIGVERVDCVEGILERFRSIENFLELHPEYLGRFSFVQVASPALLRGPRHHEAAAEIEASALRINRAFSGAVPPHLPKPIILKLRHYSQNALHRLYRAADFCMVTPLHDAMNLVAKEFVAARTDHRGVLILSRFAGAAAELEQAIRVDPYSATECGSAIHQALTMSAKEQADRMNALREQVHARNFYAWAGEFLAETLRVTRERALPRPVSGLFSPYPG